MEWGPHQAFLEGLKKTTGQTPRALLSKPGGLTFVEHQLYDAYSTISHSRTYYGEGYPNPLQFSEISAYIGIVGVYDRAAAIRLMAVVKLMDGAFLDFWTNKHRTKR